MGARSVEIATENADRPPDVLWNRTGWKEIPKTEYQSLAQQYGRRTRVPRIPWIWLVALLALTVWKFDQVCLDLGISPLKEDTLEAYFARVQRTAGELREAVQRKNIAFGLSQVYYRRLSLLRTRPEYMWLGDYPKLAEQRKQGYAVAYGAET
jgi:hypothetical protein